MAPLWKSASHVVAAASKGKSITVGDLEPIDAHPPPLEVYIEDVKEDHSFLAFALEARANGHEPNSRQRVTPPNARQPPKATGRATGEGSS